MKQIILIMAILLLSIPSYMQMKEKKVEFAAEKPKEPVALREAFGLNDLGVKKALKENDYGQASALFRKAIEIDPNCTECRYNLGRSYIKTGDLDKSIEIFKDLTRSNSAIAYAALGEALSKKGLYEESIQYYQKGLKTEPNDAVTLSNLAYSLHQTEKDAEALMYCDEAIRLSPDLAAAHSNRGVALHALKRYREALQSLRRASALKPDSAEVHNNLSVVLLQLGKKKEAQKHLLEAGRIDPNNTFTIYNLAINYLAANKREAARQQLDLLEKLDLKLAEQLKKQFWLKYVVNASPPKE